MNRQKETKETKNNFKNKTKKGETKCISIPIRDL